MVAPQINDLEVFLFDFLEDVADEFGMLFCPDAAAVQLPAIDNIAI